MEIRVFWHEKDRMLKIAVPSLFRSGICLGQVAYGVQEFHPSDDERVAQKWVAMVSQDNRHALTVINDRVHGFDLKGEVTVELRQNRTRFTGQANQFGLFRLPRMPEGSYSIIIKDGRRVIARMDLDI